MTSLPHSPLKRKSRNGRGNRPDQGTNAKISFDHVHLAYRKLKSFVYYEKSDLDLRLKLAEFESDPNFERNLQAVARVANLNSPAKDKEFASWLSQIGFRIVPKGISSSALTPQSDAKFRTVYISNVTSSKEIKVESVNYFFDGPIPLHLIAVLWLMREGWIIDRTFGTEVQGNRLEFVLGDSKDNSIKLFQKYHELYAGWRDRGIQKAKSILLNEHNSVCILGLDLKEFYYRVRPDYQAMIKSISDACNSKTNGNTTVPLTGPTGLLTCLESINTTYRERISPLLKNSHPALSEADMGLPIGLCSSQVIANWYLRRFDTEIITRVRPAYYGRYVDDLLLVVSNQEDPSESNEPVDRLIMKILVDSGVLVGPQGDEYQVARIAGMYLQSKKVMVQFFDANHSIAGLQKFQKQLEESGSDFYNLPEGEGEDLLEDVAYDILYEGSINKMRNIKFIGENRFEMARFLSKQQKLHCITDDKIKKRIKAGILQFFKGRTAIEYSDLWERVLSLFTLAKDSGAYKKFKDMILKEIRKLHHENAEITSLLRNNLTRFINLCGDLSLALVMVPEEAGPFASSAALGNFRDANLIRHDLVTIPLLNYTDYNGSFTVRNLSAMVSIDDAKTKLSPRFVHFDECLLLANSFFVNLDRTAPLAWAKALFTKLNGTVPPEVTLEDSIGGEVSNAKL